MRTIAIAVALTLTGAGAVAAAERCTPEELKDDGHWSRRLCDARGFRQAVAVASSPGAIAGAEAWHRSLRQRETLINKALKLGDVSELKRQSIEIRRQMNDIDAWPQDDRWTVARVYCANTAQELSNFVEDKLKGSARGEVAAGVSLKAYRGADKECRRGLRMAK
ncbi:hypothetical protein [Bosea minatitlanensis]|uniref:DUF1311 domain-containing protein n=1 Tax=Bosea minatitlanensis TaxID=128782 RepID=A0ABW0F1P3_9HYPH|nr:hypothetical protein [Bosea minatitlanensis]MCT4491761.1 hypothetical protein [Bosea minatitlanensis]